MEVNFNLWFKKGILYFIFLLLVILWGIFGMSKNKWCNWEDASIILTLILTIIVYAQGFWGKRKFKSVADRNFGVIGLFFIALLIVIVMCGILLINSVHQYYPDVIKFELPRWAIMLSLFITSIVLSYIDYQIGKNDDTSMLTLFYFSDFPIIVTFFILFIYSLILSGDSVMHPFFSGAIAFQMIISILLASLLSNDEIINFKTI